MAAELGPCTANDPAAPYLARPDEISRGYPADARRKIDQTRRARRNGTPVRFSLAFDDPSVIGYVIEIGPRWFVLALVGDNIRFDGEEQTIYERTSESLFSLLNECICASANSAGGA